MAYLVREERKSGKFQIVWNNPLKARGYIPENGSEIYVSRIPEKVNEYDFLRFFDQAGEIYQIRLMMAEDWRTNRGFAYVTYLNAQSRKKAMEDLANLEFMGRQLLIETSLNNCRIFISGFPTNKTKDEVWLELISKGVNNIVDVIMYKSYSCRAENRGFVFVEFLTHQHAASARAKFANNLKMWGRDMIVDWSVPVPEIDEAVLNMVKIIFLRNLDVIQTPENLKQILCNFIKIESLEKVYKFKNYAFIHVHTREEAVILMEKLKDYYKHTSVEVKWATPPSKFTSSCFRQANLNRSTSSLRREQNSPAVRSMTTPRSRLASDSSNSSREELRMLLRANSVSSVENAESPLRFMTTTPSERERQIPGPSVPSTSRQHTPQHLQYPRLVATHMEMGQFPVARPNAKTFHSHDQSCMPRPLLRPRNLDNVSHQILRPQPIYPCQRPSCPIDIERPFGNSSLSCGSRDEWLDQMYLQEYKKVMSELYGGNQQSKFLKKLGDLYGGLKTKSEYDS